MSRPNLISGDVWEPSLANAAGFPILDGSDEYGHGPKVIDDWLDDGSDQIKSRFYDWRNRLRVTVTSGLTVGWNSTSVITTTGNTVSIAAGTLTLPNNTTGFIFVNSEGVIVQSSSYPQIGIILSRFITNAGVTTLNDLRFQSIDAIAPLAIPTSSTFAIGDLKVSARVNPPTGWLLCDGSSYSTGTYPELFSAIGTTYNLPGDAGGTFRLPNLVGRVIVAAGSGTGLTPRTVGELIGSETATLSIANIPSHSHGVSQSPHTHSITTSPHSHGVSDPGHNHSFSPVPHSHGINDPGHNHTNVTYRQVVVQGLAANTGGAELSAAANSGLNVGIFPNTTNISIQANNAGGTIGGAGTGISIQTSTINASASGSTANIQVNNTGDNQPFSITQPAIVLNYFIRAS
jgi:microcystin-dependent protein